MGWAAKMLRKLESQLGQRRNTGAVEKAAQKLVIAETELSEKRHEVSRLDAAYETALHASAESGDEEPADEAFAALEDARAELAKLDRVVGIRRREHDEACRQAESTARGAAEAKALEHLGEMDAALAKITAGAEVIAAGVRAFNASKARFYDVSPVRPDYLPVVWSPSIERLLMRHIAARCSMFRASIVGCENLDALAKANELLLQHRDVMQQLFPEPPTSKAA